MNEQYFYGMSGRLYSAPPVPCTLHPVPCTVYPVSDIIFVCQSFHVRICMCHMLSRWPDDSVSIIVSVQFDDKLPANR